MSHPLHTGVDDLGPSHKQDDNLVPGTSLSRLAQAFRQPASDIQLDDPITFSSSAASVAGTLPAVPNPYGRGLAAYEPNTVLFSGYNDAYAAVQNSKAEEAAAKAASQKVEINFSGGTTDFAGGGIAEAGGKVKTMISAAMALAARHVPYVWGGTSSSGVDCSGLIYYAARAAGIDWQRYRAVDYGHMGQAVSLANARPGDIIYYDEPGDTDHVGLYIGNGQMIQAPQSGDVVKISGIGNPTSIRRIFSDAAFSAGATPSGPPQALYNGIPWIPASPLVPQPYRPPTPTTAPVITRHTYGGMTPSVY